VRCWNPGSGCCCRNRSATYIASDASKATIKRMHLTTSRRHVCTGHLGLQAVFCTQGCALYVGEEIATGPWDTGLQGKCVLQWTSLREIIASKRHVACKQPMPSDPRDLTSRARNEWGTRMVHLTRVAPRCDADSPSGLSATSGHVLEQPVASGSNRLRVRHRYCH
jgi:hypothetical protein